MTHRTGTAPSSRWNSCASLAPAEALHERRELLTFAVHQVVVEVVDLQIEVGRHDDGRGRLLHDRGPLDLVAVVQLQAVVDRRAHPLAVEPGRTRAQSCAGRGTSRARRARKLRLWGQAAG